MTVLAAEVTVWNLEAIDLMVLEGLAEDLDMKIDPDMKVVQPNMEDTQQF